MNLLRIRPAKRPPGLCADEAWSGWNPLALGASARSANSPRGQRKRAFLARALAKGAA